jgi:hypothetical protein
MDVQPLLSVLRGLGEKEAIHGDLVNNEENRAFLALQSPGDAANCEAKDG